MKRNFVTRKEKKAKRKKITTELKFPPQTGKNTIFFFFKGSSNWKRLRKVFFSVLVQIRKKEKKGDKKTEKE